MSQPDHDLDPDGAPGHGAVRVIARGQIRALLVPADHERPSVVIAVPDTAAGLSDAIGGGLLEEILHGVHAWSAYCVYADEERATKRLPHNARAAVLAARLGWIDKADRLGLLGDLLIVGAETPGRDSDIPAQCWRRPPARDSSARRRHEPAGPAAMSTQSPPPGPPSIW